MAVQLNHTIVHALDALASAQFLAEILGLQAPKRFGPFFGVDLHNGVTLDFISAQPREIIVEHYAFLVSEAEFDEILARIRARGCRTGPIRLTHGPARSIETTVAAASTGTTRTGTTSRSSQGPMGVGAEPVVGGDALHDFRYR